MNSTLVKHHKKNLIQALDLGVSPVHLSGVTQHSRATSAKGKLDKVVNKLKTSISSAFNVDSESLDDPASVATKEISAKAAKSDITGCNERKVKYSFIS